MTRSPADLGTLAWVDRTGGQLTRTDRLTLLPPLARSLAVNAIGRAAMLTRLDPGRRATVAHRASMPPASVLTRAAEQQARRRLSPALLNHSYRTYAFGAALGVLDGIDVDHELLFAAALLHDTGLGAGAPQVDFTLASARIARDVAEDVGLSTAATRTVRDAITLHHSPGVTRAHGPVAYLLSAGAGLDVVGLRSWRLPPDLVASIVAAHPRLRFKHEFSAAFRAEAAAVPRGRAQLLRRYGAFDLAIRLAPFDA